MNETSLEIEGSPEQLLKVLKAFDKTPEPRFIISVSGGNGSAVSALLAMEHGLNYVPIFADTLIEDWDLYRFNNDLQNILGKEIIKVCDGRTPWEVFDDVKYIGNTRTAHCSEQLKTSQIAKWLEENGTENDVMILGMDFSELDRLERAQKRWSIPVRSFINDYKFWRPKWAELFAKYDLKQARLYDMGFTHNNCGGFCVKAGQGQFKLLLEKIPETYARHEERMERTILKNPKARPFLRKTINGELKYLTLKQFRIGVESGWEIDPFDMGGCGCFTD